MDDKTIETEETETEAIEAETIETEAIETEEIESEEVESEEIENEEIEIEQIEIADRWIAEMMNDKEVESDEAYEELCRRIPIPVWPPYKERPKVEVLVVAYNSPEFDELIRIRHEVFVKEQNVPPDAEIDDLEEECVHYGLRADGLFVGVCRLRQKRPFMKIERVAVLKEYRSKGYGRIIVQKVLEEVLDNWPELVPVAHAQEDSLHFYKKLGAIVVGPKFMEEGIPHFTIAFMHYIKEEFEVLNYIPTTVIGYTSGEIADPFVVTNIKGILTKIQRGTEISPLDLFLLIAEYAHDLGQSYFLIEHLITLLFISKYEERAQEHRREIVRLLKELEILADHKIYTYLFSNVPDCWRKYYFVVRVLQSIWTVYDFEFTAKNADGSEIFDKTAALKTSLEYFDKALIIGGRFFDKDIIINRINFLREELPEISFKAPVQDVLQPPRPLAKSSLIPSIPMVDDETLFDEFICKRRPVIIKKAADMPAVGEWSLSYLAKKLAYRTFPVEEGTRYTDDSWKQQLMRAEEFFQKISNPNYEEGPVYLAQHRLLEQVPELMNDIRIPNYCKCTGLKDADIDINVWIGPSGTISPLHSDPRDNIFSQLVGRKFFRLILAEDSSKIYLSKGMLSNTSLVDAGKPDLAEFPFFADVTVFDGIVEEGDLLYIPAGVFHYVQALSPSSSVSFWFNPLTEES